MDSRAYLAGDEGAADCLIWRNASKEYKRQALHLDDQMRELIMLAKVIYVMCVHMS